VGEVDQAEDAVHHRVSERDQGVDRARGNPVQQILKERFHAKKKVRRKLLAGPGYVKCFQCHRCVILSRGDGEGPSLFHDGRSFASLRGCEEIAVSF
jgi:hypothetical protein